jgi:alpha-L-rhamnosidase
MANLSLDVQIPVNTTASVYIPAKDAAERYRRGKALLKNGKPYQPANSKETYVLVELGSGTYHYTAPLDGQK